MHAQQRPVQNDTADSVQERHATTDSGAVCKITTTSAKYGALPTTLTQHNAKKQHRKRTHHKHTHSLSGDLSEPNPPKNQPHTVVFNQRPAKKRAEGMVVVLIFLQEPLAHPEFHRKTPTHFVGITTERGQGSRQTTTKKTLEENDKNTNKYRVRNRAHNISSTTLDIARFTTHDPQQRYTLATVSPYTPKQASLASNNGNNRLLVHKRGAGHPKIEYKTKQLKIN